MKKLLVVTMLAGGLLAAGTVSTAAEKDPPAAEKAAQRLGRRPLRRMMAARAGRAMAMWAELDVTHEQRRQIAAILLSHKDDIANVAKPVVEKHRALRAAVKAEKLDEKAIRAAAKALGEALADAAVLAAKVRAEVAEVLTPEQQELIEKFHLDRDMAVDKFLNLLTTTK